LKGNKFFGVKKMVLRNIYKGLNEVKSLEVLWCQLTLAVVEGE